MEVIEVGGSTGETCSGTGRGVVMSGPGRSVAGGSVEVQNWFGVFNPLRTSKHIRNHHLENCLKSNVIDFIFSHSPAGLCRSPDGGGQSTAWIL